MSDDRKLKEQCKNLSSVVSCKGKFPSYNTDTPLYIEGIVEKTERFGYQVIVTNIKEESRDKAKLANYLTNIVSGIGPKTANVIAEIFSDDFFEIVKSEQGANIISEKISSIKYETAVMMCEKVRRTGLERDVYNYISEYGGNWFNAEKLVNKHGAYAIEELNNNPYTVGHECGLAFRTCDSIAKTAGQNASNEARIESALLKAFEAEVSKGNTYASVNTLCNSAKNIIKKFDFNEEIPSTIFMSVIEKSDKFVFEFDDNGNEAVYLKNLLKAETNTAFQIHRLMISAKELNFESSVVEWAEKKCGIKYAPQQRESFKLIHKSGIAIVTGGPGTGKTTTVNGLISAYEKLNPNKIIRLYAPTGRAAQRMTESTGRETITIHRLLEYKPFGNDTVHKTAADPIDADLIVVDEASMLDIELASIFLSAVKSETLVLFIGDINQFPSVGAGDVLHDMIESEKIPTVQLTTVYRQGSQSPIIVNANRINDGNICMSVTEDYKIHRCCNAETASLKIIEMTMNMFDKNNPFDVQILAPTHKGDAGISNLNTLLQSVLNPANGQAEIKYGNKTYRVGDKIILLNNNYSVGYYNGDIGIITYADSKGVEIDIFGKKIKLTRKDMNDLSLAYAITIHKSQGSEFKNVIISLPGKPENMLKRNLLYTAVTRAKKTVNIVCEQASMEKAVQTCETGKRNTRLTKRIQALLS